MTTNRYYYAAHSYMGINFTYDSPCWTVHVFNSKRDRDEWVSENDYDQGNVVSEAITAKTAYKIAPDILTAKNVWNARRTSYHNPVMRLHDYINAHKQFTYTGTIWGEYSGKLSRKDVYRTLDCLDHDNPTMTDGPINPFDYGYYIQSDNLCYYGPSTHETVLTPIR